MEGEKLRGIAFRQRRVRRLLSTKDVAEQLRVQQHHIVAFEEGVEMQAPAAREALAKIASLNTKWTTEEIMDQRTRKTA